MGDVPRAAGWFPDRPTSELPTTRLLGLRTTAPDETRELGSAVAAALRPGDVIALSGDLGAGKTCFVQGIARALGIERRVTSPTFVIVRTYPGHVGDEPVELVHVDVYRLERLQDVVELGEDTVLGADQVTVIEWGDAVKALLPSDRLEVQLHLGEAADERRIELRGSGSWAARVDGLTPSLAPWLDGGGG